MEIEITQNELDVLQRIENTNVRKFIFALLVMYKYDVINEFYTAGIFAHAHERMGLKPDYFNDEYNEFMERVNDVPAVNVFFAEVNCGTVAGKVDSNNLLAAYNEIFPELLLCECGDYYTKDKQATKQKLCKHCAEISRREKTRARVAKLRMKNVTLAF